jgi:hypothetical protein
LIDAAKLIDTQLIDIARLIGAAKPTDQPELLSL